jgi:hypothetical protein
VQHAKPDLILNETEETPRKVFLDVSQIRPGKLTLLEALDMGDAAGVDPDNFMRVLSRGRAQDKARLIYAFAWVLARRSEPELTFAEVCTYDLTVTGKPATAEETAKEAKRAKATAAVAKLAGVSTREAEQMTIAEIHAVTELTPKPRVRQVARRRRAG